MTQAVPNPLRVLIVEDEPRLRDSLGRAVREMGFEAQAAGRGEEALRLARANPPAIILLDLNLPGMSGLELLEKLRAEGSPAQAIVLTGYGDLAAAQKAMRLQAGDFLTKPCPLGELEKALDRARKRYQATMLRSLPDVEEVSSVPRAEPATLHDVERAHILDVLRRHHGNRAQAAAELGISLRTLYYRLSEYQKQGIDID